MKFLLKFFLALTAFALVMAFLQEFWWLLLISVILGAVVFIVIKKNKINDTPNVTGVTTTKTSSTSLDGYYLAYQYDDVKFYPPTEIISKVNKKILRPGAEIHLIQEPKNKYDKRAVALYISGNKIGYLLRGKLQDMANDFIENGWPIKAVLSSLTFSGGEYHGYIHLFYYRKSTKPKLKGYSDIDIHSITPTYPEATPNTPLTKKNVVFTGVFDIPLNEIMQIAVDAGATLKTRASKSVDYLVVGTQNSAFVDENGMSSKEATATKLNAEGQASIEIIDEKTFLKLAQTENKTPLDDVISAAQVRSTTKAGKVSDSYRELERKPGDNIPKERE